MTGLQWGFPTNAFVPTPRRAATNVQISTFPELQTARPSGAHETVTKMSVADPVPAAEKAEAPPVWPEPLVEDFADPEWPDIGGSTNDEVERWVLTHKRLLVRTVTWNLCAKPPPSKESVNLVLLPPNKFHLYVIGTEECERSIAQSAINPSKKNWENYLREALGARYVPLRSHTLQAIHMMAFIHEGLAHMCSVATSSAVAFGVGNTLGNKGAVGLLLRIGSMKMIFVNAHLSAHQNAVKLRNSEFHKVNNQMPVLLEKKQSFYAGSDLSVLSAGSTISTPGQSPRKPMPAPTPTSTTTAKDSSFPPTISASPSTSQAPLGIAEEADLAEAAPAPEPAPTPSAVTSAASPTVTGPSGLPPIDPSTAPSSAAVEAPDSDDEPEEPATPAESRSESMNNAILAGKGLDQIADVVVFMGDLNYRIKGNRPMVNKLLQANMHEVMLSNDQLTTSIRAGLVFQKFTEAPLSFRPTYKFDVNSDEYDTGSKARIPSWTDRILYVPSPLISCLAYNSDTSLKTSDHRPVYASFMMELSSYVQLDERQEAVLPTKTAVKFTSESQVCSIS